MKGKAGRFYRLTEKGKRYGEVVEKFLKELVKIENEVSE